MDHLSDDPQLKPNSPLNGVIHTECKTLRHVVSSAAEAEVGGIVHNAQMAIPIKTLRAALRHPQSPTSIKKITPQHTESYTTSYIKSALSHGI